VAPPPVPDAETAQAEGDSAEAAKADAAAAEAEIAPEDVPDAKDEDAEAFMRTFHEVAAAAARIPCACSALSLDA